MDSWRGPGSSGGSLTYPASQLWECLCSACFQTPQVSTVKLLFWVIDLKRPTSECLPLKTSITQVCYSCKPPVNNSLWKVRPLVFEHSNLQKLLLYMEPKCVEFPHSFYPIVLVFIEISWFFSPKAHSKYGTELTTIPHCGEWQGFRIESSSRLRLIFIYSFKIYFLSS